MLNNLSEQIRECLQHAEHCARKAAAQSDPNLKEDFLTMERRWLFLARSYEFSERLDDFSDEAKRNVDKLPKAYLVRLPIYAHWRAAKRTCILMKTAAEYRTMAEECFQWAREAKAKEVRVSLQQLAQVWLNAASKLDGLPPTRTEPPPEKA